MDWYVKVMKQYVDFRGRARRKEYWMFVLINLLIAIAIGIVDAMIGFGILGFVYAVAVFLPSIAVTVRRLHDSGRTGWWILIGLVPFVGILVILVFMVLDSQPGDNAYGPNPKAAAPA
jgi:uncharacterized membrane protein YhaH (DUF805 family)